MLLMAISIHAPTRGATIFPLGVYPKVHISIHAPTRGATLSRCHCSIISLFQSTLPREERQGFSGSTHLSENFNPRSHERSDKDVLAVLPDKTISIHAPTRGATNPSSVTPRLCLFQSTLPREERQQYCTKNLFIFIQYRQ